MAAFANSTAFAKHPQIMSFSGSSLKPLELSVVNFSPINLSATAIHRQKASTSIYTSSLKTRAGYSRINLSAMTIQQLEESTSIYKSSLKVRTGYRRPVSKVGISRSEEELKPTSSGDGGIQSNVRIFFGGLVLVGIIVGAIRVWGGERVAMVGGFVLGGICLGIFRGVLIPFSKIYSALSEADFKDLMLKVMKYLAKKLFHSSQSDLELLEQRVRLG